MSQMTKILIVEDEEFYIEEMYRHHLANPDRIIDYALSEREAIEKARCKTYDLAIVDIMLTQDSRDRGGVNVVKYLYELNEGTAIIVVSATADIDVAIETYTSGIFAFLRKGVIRPKDVVETVGKALTCKRNPNYLGKFSTLCAYLATPELVYLWEMDVISHLGVGYELFNNALWEALERMMPIMRLKKSRSSFTMHTKPCAITGSFWSKGLGKPIWISIAGHNNELIPPPQEAIQEEIYNRRKGKLLIGIWTMTGVKRDDYYDSVWEEIR